MDQKILTEKLVKKRKIIKNKLKALKLNRFETENALQPLRQILSVQQQQQPKIKLENIKKEEKLIKTPTSKRKNVSTSPIKRIKSNLEPSFINEGNTFEYSPTKDNETLQDTLQDTFQGSYFYDDSIREQQFETINDLINQDASFNLYLEQFDPLPRDYIEGFTRDADAKNKQFDHYYISHNILSEKFRFGDSELNFKGPDVIVKNKTYRGTPGLYELLFKMIPNERYITPEDRNNFKDIMLITNAHKRNFDANEQTAGHSGKKYINTIKPTLEMVAEEERKKQKEWTTRLRQPTKTKKKAGSGLLMQYNNKPYNYVHWDDPNELVDRLKILMASQYAGNNNHNNEIVSIIEELKEANIIE